ncbi:MAG: LAGLIDADG family homing endonuclease [Candidatus Yanofskybacteria bacterium]|nr:LAGLIDADG family homing endonuclease [Candidatus Yanofskybacteria bacterium]
MDKNTVAKLPGNYIAGFVDGEGCFALKFRRDKKQNKNNKKFREYFYWNTEFAIVLRSDDFNILNLIKETFGCGSVVIIKKQNQVRFSVQNPKDLVEKIIPFFKRHKLYAKKGIDFQLWSCAVKIVNKNRREGLNVTKGQRGFTKKEMNGLDHKKLQEIRNRMMFYKSQREKPFKWGNQNRK